MSGFKFQGVSVPGGAVVPPFPPNSADNGLSVDLVTGRIVLGNDVGDVTATLLSNRVIPLDIFNISLIDINGSKNELAANSMNIQDVSGFDNVGLLVDPAETGITVTGSANEPTIKMFGSVDTEQRLTFAGDFEMSQINFRFLDASIIANNYQFGDLDGFNSGVQLNMNSFFGAINFLAPWLSNPGSLVFNIDAPSGLIQIGDVNGVAGQTTFTIDDQLSTFNFFSSVTPTLAMNGTPGFTGTVSPVTSITVLGGIVTAVS